MKKLLIAVCLILSVGSLAGCQGVEDAKEKVEEIVKEEVEVVKEEVKKEVEVVKEKVEEGVKAVTGAAK